MATATNYYSLVKDLEAIEKKTGLYLTDGAIDRENVPAPPIATSFADTEAGDAQYDAAISIWWDAMISAAGMAAGMRAHEAGYDINDMIGRVIY